MEKKEFYVKPEMEEVQIDLEGDLLNVGTSDTVVEDDPTEDDMCE